MTTTNPTPSSASASSSPAIPGPDAGRAEASVAVAADFFALPELSIFIITHNERDNLPRCLDSCRAAGEIIIVDSGSTDGTVDYARQRGCDVTVTTGWPGFGAQKNRALDRCTKQWVMNLDADEWISPKMWAEIGRIVRAADADAKPAYEVSRRCWFDGRIVKCCGWWPHRVVRLWQRGKGRYRDQLVHESIAVDGTVGRLREPLDHEPYRDYWHLLQKNMAYARAGAEQMAQQGKRTTAAKVFAAGYARFLRDYFLKGGIAYGTAGFAIAVAQAVSAFAKHAMAWFDQRRVARGEPSRLKPTNIPPGQTYG